MVARASGDIAANRKPQTANRETRNAKREARREKFDASACAGRFPILVAMNAAAELQTSRQLRPWLCMTVARLLLTALPTLAGASAAMAKSSAAPAEAEPAQAAPAQDESPQLGIAPGPELAKKHLNQRDGALEHFFVRLAALEAGRAKKVRAVFYGSSEIGYDRVTSQIRRRLQARFGDGGKGFVVAAPGFRHTRHRDVKWRYAKSWDAYSVRFGRRADGRYGYGGAIAVGGAGAWVRYSTVESDHGRAQGYYDFPAGTRFSNLEVFYQTAPNAGDIAVTVDGQRVKTIATAAASTGDAVASLTLEDAPHAVELRAVGEEKNVRLYGVAMERVQGFVLDAAMVVGAWGHTHLNFDAEHLASQVARRAPDLIIFQMGAKEVFKIPDMDTAREKEFIEKFTESVRRTRAGRPQASCLVISSKDMGERRNGRIVTRQALERVVRGAKHVARNTGCAFFNLYAAMGGPGTAAAWWQHEPKLISPDLGHLMDPGAIKVGDIITDALLAAYDNRKRPTKKNTAP